MSCIVALAVSKTVKLEKKNTFIYIFTVYGCITARYILLHFMIKSLLALDVNCSLFFSTDFLNNKLHDLQELPLI